MIDAAIVTAIRARLTLRARAAARSACGRSLIGGQAVGWLDRQRARRLRGIRRRLRRPRRTTSPFVPQLRRRCRAHGRARPRRPHARRRRRADARGATSVTPSRPHSARRRGSCSSAPRHATSASIPTPRTSTASSPTVARRGCGSRGAARQRRSIPACSTTSSAAASPPDNRVADTVVKEAWEEAGIAASLAARAAAGRDGRHLPRAARRPAARDDLRPRSVAARRFRAGDQDGEAVEHRLVGASPRPRGSSATPRAATSSTADASLVVARLPAAARRDSGRRPDYAALDALRHPSCAPYA